MRLQSNHLPMQSVRFKLNRLSAPMLFLRFKTFPTLTWISCKIIAHYLQRYYTHSSVSTTLILPPSLNLKVGRSPARFNFWPERQTCTIVFVTQKSHMLLPDTCWWQSATTDKMKSGCQEFVHLGVWRCGIWACLAVCVCDCVCSHMCVCSE